MKYSSPSAGRRPGRPLSFDREAALNAAMLLFWRHGYEATSLSELTAAMRVTPPSLYAAFGDKKQLFLEAVRRYLSGPVTAQQLIDDADTAKAAAWSLLAGSAIAFTGETTPPGCLLATGAISCSAAARDVQVELARMRGAIQDRLRDRIAGAIDMGELPCDAEPDALAGHVMAVIQGLSTLARDGASRDTLLGIARMAMAAWPPELIRNGG
ncbi:TetR family transcriptional regulator [Bosea sp. AAP35]|uniref:TetR/AcrR family transcriptional regulator n=1 Tax=Bosea sp. AAP35 TaxID=1523417 RepID=UPI0006B8D269|nr:TetR/AcrR family transcriptional regulator [Bosea sp. AAP35]KPF72876.1 TetR family transcriptional regulator [Bosea sp. AAP35]